MAIYLSRVVVRFAVSPSQRRRRALVEYFVLRRRDEQSCSRAGSSTRPWRGRARRVTRQPRRCTASGEHTCRGRCVGRRRRRASAAAIARQGEQGLQLARTARLPPARSRTAERALLKRLYRQLRVWSANGCVRRLFAVKGTAVRASPSALGSGGQTPRLALTIGRHGRLTQRSHCCDPCSPRRCSARQVVSPG